ncbi:MAG: FAD-binding protein [Myxococcales bacterium]|nr:FAD-binding protein [Myxococcales bacterium]
MNAPLSLPPVPDAFAAALAQIRGGIRGELRDDDVHRLLYATDASLYEVLPVGVAFPESADDIVHIVRCAAAFGLPLTPRGAGTSLAGQTVGPGLVVDVGRRMNAILDIDPQARTARVQPGVVRDDLNRALAPHGLLFGPDTSTSNRCMIGGMIGNNSCGSHSILYGTTRDHVASLDVVLADATRHTLGPVSRDAWRALEASTGAIGEATRTLRALLGAHGAAITAAFPKPAVSRRNTGYALDDLAASWLTGASERDPDLARFFCGSEGTLGIATEAVVTLDVLPGGVVLFVAHFETIEEALRATVDLLPHRPAAIELMDKRVLDLSALNPEQQRNRWFLDGDPGAILVVELYGETVAAAEATAREAIDGLRARGQGYAWPVIPAARARSVWALREAGLGVLMGTPGDVKPITLVEDTAVAVVDLPAYIDEFRGVMERHDAECVYYAHAGAGELHLRPELNPKDAADVARAVAIASDVADLVKRFGGSLSGEHGDGRLRSPFLVQALGHDAVGWLGEVKYAFDPAGVFNPGNIVDPKPMTDDWRFGPEYREVELASEFEYAAAGGMQRAIERCNGAGVCRKPAAAGGTMCPSFMVTLDEADTTRARANLFRHLLQRGPDAMFGSDELYEALDLCLSCKGCKSDCPASVDMATLKAELTQGRMDRLGVPLRSRMFAEVTQLTAWMQHIPGLPSLVSAAQGWGLSKWVLERVLGISKSRTLPAFAPRSYRQLAARQLAAPGPDVVGRVVLFVDEFTDRYEPELAVDAAALLRAGGFEVVTPAVGPSGRTWLSKGLVRDARLRIEANLRVLADHVDACDAIVGIEPSAVLTLRDEAVDLVRDPELRRVAERVASKTTLVPDFVAKAAADGRWRSGWTEEPRRVLLHGHCHQKAQLGVEGTRAALALPANYTVEVVPSGCCGMAGSFGYEAEHAEFSMRVGELVLFPAVRAASADTVVAAPGTSCRHQIHDGTGRSAEHPVRILRAAQRPLA